MTLLYLASTAALLVVACAFLEWSLSGNEAAARRGLLASKVEVLRLLLREQPAKADVLADEVEHEASGSHLLKYYIRILDAQGRVLLESSGMSTLLPPSLFPTPVAAGSEPSNSVQRELPSHRSFVLLSVEAPVGAGGREIRTVQIAHDISASMAMLADYRRKLIAVLGVGLAFAAVAGVWVARQGMRPLIEITRTTQHITANQLNERIAGAPWPAELAELAAAFDAMLDRLEDSFTRLSQFSADLGHDLRTPINNLRGEAEVALARRRTPEEYQQILESSLEEYERLSRMIESLLFLARADNPDAAVERVWFDARKEIEAVREFYEPLAIEQEVGLSCAGEGWLVGDPLLFRRAVSNLVANALQHTPAGKTVYLAVCQLDNQAVEVSVRDTGRGIAPEHLPRVFDRFYRADRTRPQAPGGAGLGLAIVQSIMRLHGGTATVQSVLRQGTTVTLHFPVLLVAQVSKPAVSPTSQSAARRW